MNHFPYFSPEHDRTTLTHFENELQSQEIIDLLRGDALLQQVTDGNVTLAIIRPELEGSTNIEGQDIELAEKIERSIVRLGVMAKFSVRFDAEAVDEFYDETKESQLGKNSERNGSSNRWEEFSGIMTAGPSTVLLLYSPNGDAIDLWRSQVGHWDIVNRADPDTIRGRFGVDNYNNLVHGSDGIDSVFRELDIIARCLDSHRDR